MKVIDTDTRKPFLLYQDEELKNGLREHYESRQCDHARLDIRRAVVGGGQVQFKRQCLDCGESIGTAISHATAPKDPPAFDLSIAEARKTAQEAQYAVLIQTHVRRQRAKEGAFWTEYNKYLTSPKWAAKRALVMKRANNTCEGCLERAATQVHHLSYRHKFNEFLFELVAVCDDCHQRLHAEEVADTPAEPELQAVEPDDDWYEAPCCACRYQDERDYEHWCGKFDLAAATSMSEDGPCGPRQRELEPLK